MAKRSAEDPRLTRLTEIALKLPEAETQDLRIACSVSGPEKDFRLFSR